MTDMTAFFATYQAALADPEERPFVEAAQVQQLTDEARAVYRDLLLERGDPRGTLLALAARLHDPTPHPNRPQMVAEFAALAAEYVGFWWSIMSDNGHILGCGRERVAEPYWKRLLDRRRWTKAVRFAVECDRSFVELEPTDRAEVRRCGHCRQDIHYCETRADAEANARDGHCIAIGRGVYGAVTSEVTEHVVGRPHMPSLWAARIFAD